MKRYKVVTDNLDWRGINLGNVIEFWDGLRSYPVIDRCGTTTHIEEYFFKDILIKHPEWLQEIKDSPKEYTEDDMLSFGREVDNACTAIIGVNSLFHSWKIKNRKS